MIDASGAEMKMKTVYVVGIDFSVKKMFESEGWNVLMGTPPYNQGNVDLVCFTGGADVSPYLYGGENISSSCDPIRDEFEVSVYEDCKDMLPMVGICRGGQFLNVMNGGKMKQHIDGHSSGYYTIQSAPDEDGNRVSFTTHEDHHQGMILANDWWDSPNIPYPVYWDARDDNLEVVFYPGTESLCFQAHPEWGHAETKELFFALLKEYLGV